MAGRHRTYCERHACLLERRIETFLDYQKNLLPQPAISGNIQNITIHYDGTGSEEIVVHKNQDTMTIQAQNRTLRDIADHIITFPNFVMHPDQECRVYTNENHPEYCGFNYQSASAIWNNSGDCAYLRNSV